MLVDVLMIETVILLANALRGRGITINAGAPGPVAVTDCNRNGSGLQSARFWDHIKCLYRHGQDHIICL
jgi:hypothetical protein